VLAALVRDQAQPLVEPVAQSRSPLVLVVRLRPARALELAETVVCSRSPQALVELASKAPVVRPTVRQVSAAGSPSRPELAAPATKVSQWPRRHSLVLAERSRCLAELVDSAKVARAQVVRLRTLVPVVRSRFRAEPVVLVLRLRPTTRKAATAVS
jgi:hypothetical protein